MLIRDPANRVPPQALLCTDLTRKPAPIVSWFMQRWSVEVAFHEVRRHLGVETQRQWLDKAITPHQPCLLALFSIVTLPCNSQHANDNARGSRVVPRTTSDLRRCPGRGAGRVLARARFGDIASPTGSNETSLRLTRPRGLRRLLRRMNGQSRAKVRTQVCDTPGASVWERVLDLLQNHNVALGNAPLDYERLIFTTPNFFKPHNCSYCYITLKTRSI